MKLRVSVGSAHKTGNRRTKEVFSRGQWDKELTRLTGKAGIIEKEN